MSQMALAARRALVVEDDGAIRLVLSTILEDEGYQVTGVGTAEAALQVFPEGRMDIVIVDLRLPRMQGLELIRALRGLSQVPIVVVTAQADGHDVVACLEAGADDYVTKPFIPKELTARIRTILRRVTQVEGADPTPGTARLTLDPRTAEAVVDARAVALTPIEYRLLEHLLNARGAVVSRMELLRVVWGYEHAGDGRVVDNLVYRLRAKLGHPDESPELIATVRGFGYRIPL
jgi:DNA-binding response OmpR family regulator